LDSWLAILVDNLEWEVLDITLYVLVVELATNETLDVVNCPEGVGSELVLGCVTIASDGGSEELYNL
jgi:hypothetical protein